MATPRSSTSETELIERLARVEAEVENMRSALAPLSVEMRSILERLAMINERIAAHLDNTHRIWAMVESHSAILNELKTQQGDTCTFCNSVRRGFWIALTAAIAGAGWIIQRWIEKGG